MRLREHRDHTEVEAVQRFTGQQMGFGAVTFNAPAGTACQFVAFRDFPRLVDAGRDTMLVANT